MKGDTNRQNAGGEEKYIYFFCKQEKETEGFFFKLKYRRV